MELNLSLFSGVPEALGSRTQKAQGFIFAIKSVGYEAPAPSKAVRVNPNSCLWEPAVELCS